jgi:signal peptidase I
MNEINKQEDVATQSTSLSSYFSELGRFLLIAIIIIVPLRLFIAEPFIVSGTSMLPNFFDKEYLIVDKITYHTRNPERGDVIVFKNPRNESEYYIKRVIGTPGDTVEITNGSVTIIDANHPKGFKLNESYLPNNLETQGSPEPVTLGKDEYYVLGDNRTASSDSRVWGKLMDYEIVGKVRVRVLPFSRFTYFSQLPNYN